MNDYSQQQVNDPLASNNQTPVQQSDTVIPEFKIDLSGLVDKASASEPTIIGSSLETGPIMLDRKNEQPLEMDKKIEFGNETIQNIERGREELKSEKIENAVEANVGNNNNTISAQPQDDKKPEVKTDVKDEVEVKKVDIKYSGYPIDEEIISDVERVKREKGKGDSSDGFSAVLLFIDRLFRIRDRAK